MDKCLQTHLQNVNHRLKIQRHTHKYIQKILRESVLCYQFQIPTLKGSDFLKEQGPKLSIFHCASLEIVSTLESAIFPRFFLFSQTASLTVLLRGRKRKREREREGHAGGVAKTFVLTNYVFLCCVR
jgi:hypothetical protein